MSTLLGHRGPDAEGKMIAPGIGLAMRRLAIIDLEHGQQPIANETGSIRVIQNGEIYNFEALRGWLEDRGHEFRTQSDTEVLVHLYEEQGLDGLRQLRGMFALALWDEPKRRLVLARDRYGIKPLLYAVRNGVVAFSSEMKSLLESGIATRTVSGDALRRYLMFNWVAGTDSILVGVHKLAPGHILVADGRGIQVQRFAGPVFDRSTDLDLPRTDDLLAAELVGRLRDSVRAHLIADVPVGVLLSGGIDSSMLTALAADETRHLKTFSIAFADQRFDESHRARLVAERYGTDHHELKIEPDISALMLRLAKTFDQPLGDSSVIPTYLVAEHAARHVKVVLSGDGGDELFGGYNTYTADLLSRWTGPGAALLRPIADRLPDTPFRAADRIKRFVRGAALPPLERHCSWLEVWSRDAVASALNGIDGASCDPLRVFRERYDAAGGSNWLTRFQHVDIGTYLVDDLLLKVDLASMAHSLEVRVPFLDSAVADFAYALDRKQKIRGLKKKVLLRKAAKELLPKAVLKARKQGFSMPAASWLRNELRDYAGETLSTRPSRTKASSSLPLSTISWIGTSPVVMITADISGLCSRSHCGPRNMV